MDEDYAQYLARTEQWEKLKSYDPSAHQRLRGESTRTLRDINQKISPPTPQAILKHAGMLFEHVQKQVSHETNERAYREKKLWGALNELSIEVHRQEKTIRQLLREINELRGGRR
jgi:hypothetical protein